MSNEVGRVKSDSASFLILLQTPVHERSRHLCSERLARVSILFSRSNLMARSVSLHRFGVAHQTCLRSRTTMMTFSNSLPAQREAGSLIRRDVFHTIRAQAIPSRNFRTGGLPPPHLLCFLTLSHQPPALPITHFQKNSYPPPHPILRCVC